ncbi:MAG: (2Fe-2S)-binding protein [Halodesulfurarchaeum sp.]
MEIELSVNGQERTYDVAKTDSLLDVLRRDGYTGTNKSCDTGSCSMCRVLVDGEPRESCITPAVQADGFAVETIEGIGSQDDLHPVQQAFIDNAAMQCGFCTPGMIMTAVGLLRETPDPSREEVRETMDDVLCRCTGYQKIVEAVLDAADRMQGRTVAADGGSDPVEPTTEDR